jgi:hypothetical protein
MMPARQDSKLDTNLANRGAGPTASPGALNYGYLHRGTIIVATSAGAVRMELYQRRSMERLSLAN